MNKVYTYFLAQWLKGKGMTEVLRYIFQKAYGAQYGTDCINEIQPILNKYNNSSEFNKF